MKYQYNNVMALLKGQKEFIKNLETVRSSAGWADEQVGLQQETITRQIAGLKADLEQFVVTMEKIGANKSIANLIKDIRGLIAVLNEISPEGFQGMVDSIKWFLFLQGLDLVQVGLIKTVDKFNIAKDAIKSFSISSIRDIKNWKNISTAFSIVTGYVGAFIIALQAGLAIYEAWEEHNKKLVESLDVSKVTNSFSDLSSKTNDIRELSKAIQDNQAIVDDSTKSDNEKLKAEKALSDSKKRLLELLPEEAQARVRASGYAKEAIERELNMLYKLQEQKMLESENAIKAEISKTQATISQTENRITAYTKEIEALTERNNMLAESSKLAKQFGFDGITDEYGNNYEEQNKENIEYFKNLKTEAEQLKKDSEQKIKDLQQQLKDLKESYKVNTVDIKGTTGGITEGNDGNNNRGTSTGNTNYNQQATRTEYQLKRNNLWYEGSIQAKQYSNALREITNNEELYGKTLESIKAKGILFEERSIQLKSYEADLKVFKDELIAYLDDMMAKNTELANKVGWRNNLTEQEKLKNIEVNKELYQQVKTYSELVNMINQTVQKLEDVKTKQIDIANQAKKNKEEHLQEQLDIITRQYENLVTGQKGTYVSDTQKDRDRLNYLKELKELQEKSKNEAYKDWLDSKNDGISTEQDIAGFRRLYEEKLRIVQETNAQIREIENQGLLGYLDTVRSSMQSNFSNMLLQGTSFKNAMKNIWSDLCRHVIEELIRVYIVEQLTGMLFKGLSGGGENPLGNIGDGDITIPFGGITSNGWESYAPWKSHMGSHISSYPKMHSGGAVAKGRAGVNPKLKNDEVVRTLQVGEEVNSIKDRRSNEIMAMVAMKAMEKDGNQPQNITINALDSRSFAEYMNDNADILTAILAKQGVLGRR